MPPYFQISHRLYRRSRCVKLGPPDSQRRLQRQQSESWLLHSIRTIFYWSYKLLYLNYSAKYHEWLNVFMYCICLRSWYFWLETMIIIKEFHPCLPIIWAWFFLDFLIENCWIIEMWFFFRLVNSDLFFLQNFQGLISMKVWLIDTKGMDMAQRIGLSGCPKKDQCSMKIKLKWWSGMNGN